jgi:endonuclease YncB( thermonuclease family)
MTYDIQIQFFFDGDSGQFSNGERFRLADVRSPDKDDPDYLKAKRVVTGMAGRNRRRVTVEEVGIDPYSRLLVKIYNEDGSINDRMRQRGYC